jgi:hypothetical protein
LLIVVLSASPAFILVHVVVLVLDSWPLSITITRTTTRRRPARVVMPTSDRRSRYYLSARRKKARFSGPQLIFGL